MQLKDFIITDEKSVKTLEKSKTKSLSAPPVFCVEYENDYDFILKKKTSRSEKLLVCIVSQAQLYIKNVKDNTIEFVTNIKQVSNFIRGMTTAPKFEKLVWTPFHDACYWAFTHVSSSMDKLLNYQKACMMLANNKINPFTNVSLLYDCARYPESFDKRQQVMKMLRLIDDKFEGNSDFALLCTNLMEAHIDYNMIKANLDVLKEMGVDLFIKIFTDRQSFSPIINYGCDFKRLMNYFLYTITYRNGLKIGMYNEFNISQYVDYLRMQQEMYGKVKEKYPLYWLSEKQMMNNKYNKWREMRCIEGFDLGQEAMKKYEFEDDVYKVIVPLKSTDILDEAQQQQHCVASYINRVARGETHIVFIRQKLNEEESCLTVEISTDERIVQVRGFQNRQYSALEYSFMKKWAEEKNLKLEVAEVV